jgi:hypothetical protein
MAKTRPTSRRRQLPRLAALLVCDGVGKDSGSNKTTLYGLFDRLVARNKPITARFVVFARLVGGAGQHDFLVRLTSKRGKEIVRLELGESMECRPDKKIDIFCQIAGVELPAIGDYFLSIASGDKTVGDPLKLPVVAPDKVDKAKDG